MNKAKKAYLRGDKPDRLSIEKLIKECEARIERIEADKEKLDSVRYSYNDILPSTWGPIYVYLNERKFYYRDAIKKLKARYNK